MSLISLCRLIVVSTARTGETLAPISEGLYTWSRRRYSNATKSSIRDTINRLNQKKSNIYTQHTLVLSIQTQRKRRVAVAGVAHSSGSPHFYFFVAGFTLSFFPSSPFPRSIETRSIPPLPVVFGFVFCVIFVL